MRTSSFSVLSSETGGSRPVAVIRLISTSRVLPLPAADASNRNSGAGPVNAGRAKTVSRPASQTARCSPPMNGNSDTRSSKTSTARLASSFGGLSGTGGNSADDS